ncbi:MAG: type II toxin-antitoxin system RelE/ParE family toxin [bacterium]|nr:type II toxin-antitoxin system RelE/ParE family toxin [bacterium]
MYKIEIDEKAEKQLCELPQDIFEKVNEVILSLKYQSRPKGVKKLEGVQNGWRIEVRKKYRILYTIDDKNKVVTIFKVKHRKDVYRGV